MSTTGLYAYAITRGLDPATASEQSGIGGQPVRLVEREGLAVVVSEVDLEQFMLPLALINLVVTAVILWSHGGSL